ncbi:MAG: MFS transporter [Pseudomonadota bacterium]
MTGILVLAGAYIISHFYRSFLAVLSPYLEADLGMSSAQMSDALGAWFVAFAVSQIPVGVLLDRIGPRRTSALMFGVIGGFGGGLFAIAQSPTAVLVAMVALGVGCSPVLMASVYLFKRSFEPRRFAALASTFIAIGLAGNIIGSSPLALALEAWGWRAVMMVLTGATVALALGIMVLVKDPPNVDNKQGGQGSYLDILKLRELWSILPLIFFIYSVAGGLRGIWAGPYLAKVHGLSATEIGTITFWMAIAMVAGSFAYGPADTLFNTRKWVVFTGAVIAFAALMFWVLNPAASAFQVAIVLVIIGFFSLCYGLLMAHATANIPDHLAGRGVTLVNFFNMGGVGTMQWVTSAVYRDAGGDAEPLIAISSVLWVYAACFGATLVLYAFSKDAKPNPAAV